MKTNSTQPLKPFTPAHASFLAQLSDNEFWSHAAEMAYHLSAATDSRNSEEDIANDYLLCELGQGACLLPLASLHEVMVLPAHFTRLPFTPSWLLGVMAWRDEAIAVVDLTAYLLFPPSQLSLSSPPPAFSTSPLQTSSQPLAENARLVIISYENSILALQVAPIHTDTALPAVNEEIAPATLERVQYHEVIADTYQGAFILNMEALVAHIVQQIGTVSPHE